MAWSDVDEKRGGGGGGRFVTIEDGKPVMLRILDEEPHTIRVHKIGQPIKKGDKIEEVYRTIPATASPDENYILQHNGKRYPDVPVFNMRCYEYKRDDKGALTTDGELKILQGGPGIFKQLQTIYSQFGHLNAFDIVISRKGKGRDTEYTVSASPKAQNIDVNALVTKVMQDPGMQWENIFPPVTRADQIKAITEAGFDISYDPAAKLLESLSWEKASEVKMGFGKYKDKTVGELLVIDAGYLTWAAENVTSNDLVAAACRLACKRMEQMDSGSAPAPQIPASAPAAAPAEVKADRAALESKIADIFENDERFQDLEFMVNVIKKNGGGKTRLKDLTIPQMNALLAEISNG